MLRGHENTNEVSRQRLTYRDLISCLTHLFYIYIYIYMYTHTNTNKTLPKDRPLRIRVLAKEKGRAIAFGEKAAPQGFSFPREIEPGVSFFAEDFSRRKSRPKVKRQCWKREESQGKPIVLKKFPSEKNKTMHTNNNSNNNKY